MEKNTENGIEASPHNDLQPKEKYYIAILGSIRSRVLQILSHVQEQQSNDDNTIDFLPCLASFASYQDENGNKVKYLSSVTTIGNCSNLAPYFDDGSIQGAVIGGGITSPEDMASVQSLINGFSGSSPIELELLQINEGEEGLARKERMIALVLSVAERVKKNIRNESGNVVDGCYEDANENNLSNEVTSVSDEEKEAPQLITIADQLAIEDKLENSSSQTRYACRMCRTVLFSENDLEDPPHVPYRHRFSRHKPQSSSSTSSCQSVFLADPLPWMGDLEGKISCPKCEAKLGIWKWSGSQCSCGTWVTPSIAVALSRIDVTDRESRSILQERIVIGPQCMGISMSK